MKSLLYTDTAQEKLNNLQNDHAHAEALKAVLKALEYMQIDLHHPSLHTHQYHQEIEGKKLFEAYAQQHTPGAYRIFWYYGPEDNEITIVDITPHPNDH